MKMKTAAYTDKMILVRGGGDLATGVIHKLHQSGYQVLILECRPSKCHSPSCGFLVKLFMTELQR